MLPLSAKISGFPPPIRMLDDKPIPLEEHEPEAPHIPYRHFQRFLWNIRKWPRILIPKPLRQDYHISECHTIIEPIVVGCPAWTTSSPTHRCLHITEILSPICEFVRQQDDEACCHEGWKPTDRTVGKRTLASLARTCRSFSEPALDALWMKLDLLDPLIKVLPQWMWAEKHTSLLIRMLSKEKHWLTFRKYAERVRFVRGPCQEVPASIQRRIISSLARLPEALPLLPNLVELVWSDLKTSKLDQTSVSLLRYFAGPRLAAISVFLGDVNTEITYQSLSVLFELFSLCPTAASFATFFTEPDHQHRAGTDQRWRRLWERQSSLLSTLAFGIELSGSAAPLPANSSARTVHGFSLGRNFALPRSHHPHPMYRAPTSCRIHCQSAMIINNVGLLGETLTEIINASRLQSLLIDTPRPIDNPKYINESIIKALLPLSTLRELDMDSLGSQDLKDEHYVWISQVLTELRILKVGTVPPSTKAPEASFEAVLAILEGCKHLETLHILFDANSVRNDAALSLEPVLVDTRGISNERITRIHVGRSPIQPWNVGTLATCLRELMPRLEMIDSSQEAGTWGEVQDRISKAG